MIVTAYIALGSNRGDRRQHLDRALQELRDSGVAVVTVSDYYETEPVGGPPGQRPYLNAVAELHTGLDPVDLLHVLLDTERRLGRVRRKRHGPRTIDLDLLLYGDLVRDQPDPIVPHPRMHERTFVLEPLVEIAPDAVHPRLGRTAAELLDDLNQASRPSSYHTSQPGAEMAGRRIASSLTQRRYHARPADRELAGLRALVTGSTSGIGRAIALELAAGGAAVLVHGRHLGPASEVTDQIRKLNVPTGPILADLSVPEECDRLVRTAWGEGLDIWINNAGADTLTGAAAHWPFARKLEELLTVDLRATILLSRDIGKRMKKAGGGVIVNMGWDQAETGMEGDSGQLFAAAKGAVMAFSKSLALSLAPEVRVNCLAPGWIKTAWGERASEVWQERVLRETPLQRWGTPMDVARVARWLVSPAASFITGQVIRVDGGAVR
jgi:3-oxoacyl-[acyl-carrier protein] reductase